MIVFHTVVRSRPIPLINYRLDTNHKPIPFYSKSCCGECRGSGLLNTTEKECRCTDFESYSTSCRCITLRDGIFFVSTAIRQEALKHYWKENTFIYQGKSIRGTFIPSADWSTARSAKRSTGHSNHTFAQFDISSLKRVPISQPTQTKGMGEATRSS